MADPRDDRPEPAYGERLHHGRQADGASEAPSDGTPGPPVPSVPAPESSAPVAPAPELPEAPAVGAGSPSPNAAGAARPAPAYGEYAPEGWDWKPPADTAAQGQGALPANGSGSSPITGVPHNLGAPGTPAAPGAAASGGVPPYAPPPQQGAPSQRPGAGPAPYRAAEPQAAPMPRGGATYGPKPRTGDRVVTILLLVIGAFGALNSAASFFSLDARLRLTAEMVGIESIDVAPWVGTLGLIGGLVILALYAVTVIFSIQRMRARKVAFWVPLTAGAIAVLLVLVIPMFAMAGAPEIMQQLESDPNGSLERMMQYLQGME
ncbi:MAG: DUF6264 family protein [Leucobacter sp.]